MYMYTHTHTHTQLSSINVLLSKRSTKFHTHKKQQKHWKSIYFYLNISLWPAIRSTHLRNKDQEMPDTAVSMKYHCFCD